MTTSRLVTRSRFLASSSVIACAAPLAACSSSNVNYAQAVAQTWRPFDIRILKREALQRELVRYATLAPSSHNTQCWKFQIDRNAIVIRPDFTRRCPAVDPDEHHLFVSLGCATENLVQAALAHGFQSHVRYDPADGGMIRVALEPAKPVDSPLFGAISIRQCTRGLYDGNPLHTNELHVLEDVGRGNGVNILLLTGRSKIDQVSAYVIRGNTVQMNDPAFMDELRTWIRFNDAEAIAKGDGLSSHASGNVQVPRWLGKFAFKFAFRPQSENARYANFVRSSAGIAVFVSDASDKEHWVETGRCYERFVLQATAMGIRTAMVNQPVEVASLRNDFGRSLGVGSRRPDLVVRFGRGAAMPRSLRRPLDAVIESEAIAPSI